MAQFLLAFTVLALAVSASATGSVPRYEAKRYVGATGDVLLQCDPTGDSAIGVGGACFPLSGAESAARIDIFDSVGWRVGGFARAFHGSTILTETLFCNSTNLPLPDTSTKLYVYTRDVWSTEDCGSTGAATKGWITITFT